MQKSPDFISRQNCPICRPRYSMFYLRRFCRPTFSISDYKFCLCCHDDCLQCKMNIYFSYLSCLLLFSFIRCRKKVMQVLFCDLHLAVVLAISYKVADENIGRVSWFTDFVGWFCQATKPHPQKLADCHSCDIPLRATRFILKKISMKICICWVLKILMQVNVEVLEGFKSYLPLICVHK